jgi:hypothetical protein
VSQISPPIRILLVSAVAFMAAWMLFLRPGTDAEVTTPPAAAPAPNTQTGAPAVSQPGKIAESAQGAVDATNDKLGKVEAADGSAAAPATGSATGTGTKPATKSANGAAPAAGAMDLAGLPKPVAKAVKNDKVLVLLFWNDKSADDRAVRRELRRVDRWDGEVVVQAAPIKSVSRYGRVTRGADVQQSPTVVVVDRNLKAERLVGYVDRPTIDQAVVDAMRNSGVLIKDPYLRSVNDWCATTSIVGFGGSEPSSGAGTTAFAKRQRGVARRANVRFAGLKAPARFRGFKRATMRDHAALIALYGEWATFLGPNPSGARVVQSLTRFSGREKSISRRYDRRMDDRHLLACGSQA